MVDYKGILNLFSRVPGTTKSGFLDLGQPSMPSRPKDLDI